MKYFDTINRPAVVVCFVSEYESDQNRINLPHYLAKELDGVATVIKISIEKNPDLCKAFAKPIHTTRILFYQNAELKQTFTPLIYTAEDIIKSVKQWLS